MLIQEWKSLLFLMMRPYQQTVEFYCIKMEQCAHYSVGGGWLTHLSTFTLLTPIDVSIMNRYRTEDILPAKL